MLRINVNLKWKHLSLIGKENIVREAAVGGSIQRKYTFEEGVTMA